MLGPSCNTSMLCYCAWMYIMYMQTQVCLHSCLSAGTAIYQAGNWENKVAWFCGFCQKLCQEGFTSLLRVPWSFTTCSVEMSLCPLKLFPLLVCTMIKPIWSTREPHGGRACFLCWTPSVVPGLNASSWGPQRPSAPTGQQFPRTSSSSRSRAVSLVRTLQGQLYQLLGGKFLKNC